VRITWVSKYRKFKLDTCNWTPTWSHADYVTNRRAENQSRTRILLQIRLRTKSSNFHWLTDRSAEMSPKVSWNNNNYISIGIKLWKYSKARYKIVQIYKILNRLIINNYLITESEVVTGKSQRGGHGNLRSCGDLKPYGVRCFCFSRCGVRWNEIVCGAGVFLFTL